jgi:hypothetical protein
MKTLNSKIYKNNPEMPKRRCEMIIGILKKMLHVSLHRYTGKAFVKTAINMRNQKKYEII